MKTIPMEDPAGIKLFGKKIVLPIITKSINIAHTCLEDEKVNRAAAEKDHIRENCSEIKEESDTPKTPSIDEETKQESTNSQHKTLKKPEKILPCPRCTSMDTKFCYYNNYNVKQPRHFCKSCQRYWTAGGAMRNMAVGAGRRKNKNPASHARYITVSQESVTTSNSVPENLQVRYIPVSTICPPMPIYQSTYWNCIPFLPPSTPTITDSILRKRSTDGFLMTSYDDNESKKLKNSILTPKTLRIDDPNEAARSSIWTTLGIKNENFNMFQEKSKEGKNHIETTTSPALQANPAALSRSIFFQETA